MSCKSVGDRTDDMTLSRDVNDRQLKQTASGASPGAIALALRSNAVPQFPSQLAGAVEGVAYRSRFRFCDAASPHQPPSKISNSPLGVTGHWFLKPRNLNQASDVSAQTQQVNRRRAVLCQLKAGRPLRKILWTLMSALRLAFNHRSVTGPSSGPVTFRVEA